MGAASLRAVLVLALAACALTPQARAQQAAGTYQPHSGQAGKDVVWVPTPQALVDRMLDMAKVTPADFVMDLGSGDGRTVITAAKRGARALGVEYNPDMVELSKRNAEKEGVADKATFVKADLFQTDFSKATVITMFLLPAINLKLRPKILALRPGTRVVSNSFTMDDWNADASSSLGPETGCRAFCVAYFWIVPARVGGRYNTPQGEITLRQNFQMLSGTLAAGGQVHMLAGRVTGEEIAFTAGGRDYRGRLNGTSLELR